MNIQRLNKLLDSLRAPLQPEEIFDMNCYIEKGSCYTAACAYGLYFLHHQEENPPGKWQDWPNMQYLTTDLIQLAEHFDITRDQQYELFQPCSYRSLKITRQMVIDRINTLLKG